MAALVPFDREEMARGAPVFIEQSGARKLFTTFFSDLDSIETIKEKGELLSRSYDNYLNGRSRRTAGISADDIKVLLETRWNYSKKEIPNNANLKPIVGETSYFWMNITRKTIDEKTIPQLKSILNDYSKSMEETRFSSSISYVDTCVLVTKNVGPVRCHQSVGEYIHSLINYAVRNENLPGTKSFQDYEPRPEVVHMDAAYQILERFWSTLNLNDPFSNAVDFDAEANIQIIVNAIKSIRLYYAAITPKTRLPQNNRGDNIYIMDNDQYYAVEMITNMVAVSNYTKNKILAPDILLSLMEFPDDTKSVLTLGTPINRTFDSNSDDWRRFDDHMLPRYPPQIAIEIKTHRGLPERSKQAKSNYLWSRIIKEQRELIKNNYVPAHFVGFLFTIHIIYPFTKAVITKTKIGTFPVLPTGEFNTYFKP